MAHPRGAYARNYAVASASGRNAAESRSTIVERLATKRSAPRARPARWTRRSRPGDPAAYVGPLVLLVVTMVAIVVAISVAVVVVILVAVVVMRELLAEALREAIVGIARQDRARCGLRDQAICVLLEQEPPGDSVLGRMPHDAVVALLAPIALLDRGARIAGRDPLRPGDGKRNVTGGQTAFVALQRAARDRVPARVRS